MNMVSGLFKGHAINSPYSKAQLEHSLNSLAELLALDLPINECADRMMVTRGTACVLLHKLRERYGVQAS